MKLRVPVDEFSLNINKWQKVIWNHVYGEPKVRHRVLVWHRRARKTTLGINLLTTEAATEKDNVYNYIGPTQRQAKKTVWQDPMMLKRYIPRELLKKDFNETELYGEFKSGSILNVGGADNPDRWRGTGGKGWILDEFAVMRNGMALYQEIIIPIIEENDGWVMFTFTPKGRNHGYEIWEKAKNNPRWQGFFLPADTSGLLSKEKLKEIQEEIPSVLYDQEYMCKFLAAGGGIIPNVRRNISGVLREPEKKGRYVIGVDLAKKEDFTVLTCINRDTRHVDAWARFNRIDWGFQKERIARMAIKYNNALLMVDENSMGDAVIDDLKRLRLSVEGYLFTERSKRDLCQNLIVAIEGRHVTYPDVEQMINELEDFDIDERGRYKAPEGLYDDCVISLALAVWGMKSEVFRTPVDIKKVKAKRAASEKRMKAMINHGMGDRP